jgi:hypothetical protein
MDYSLVLSQVSPLLKSLRRMMTIRRILFLMIYVKTDGDRLKDYERELMDLVEIPVDSTDAFLFLPDLSKNQQIL